MEPRSLMPPPPRSAESTATSTEEAPATSAAVVGSAVTSTMAASASASAAAAASASAPPASASASPAGFTPQPGCSTLLSTPVILTPAGNKPRKRVVLGKGYSQMDWLRLVSRSASLTGVDRPVPTLTMDEVRKHNTADDAWMVLRGNVFNITPYLKFHPGGVDELMRGAGVDATALFDEIHPWVNAERMLAKCFIGRLDTGGGGGGAAVAAPAAAAAAPAVGASAPVTSSGASARRGPPTVLPLDTWTSCTVSAVGKVCTDTMQFRFTLPPGMTAWCKGNAVQHVDLSFVNAAGMTIVRPYTPLAVHAGGTGFDLAVKLYPGGAMSGHLQSLPAGAPIQVRRRAAAFTIERLPDGVICAWGGSPRMADALVLLCGGTGVTPMLQAVHALAADSSPPPPPPVHLVCAHHSATHVICASALSALACAHPSWLHVTVVVSSGPAAGDPAASALIAAGVGLKVGRLDQDLLASVLPKPTADTVVAWCGPPGFSEAMDTAARRLFFVAYNFFGFDG